MRRKDLIKCHDCGMRYEPGAPHQMFCAARTCDGCGTTYGQVIEKNAAGERICAACREAE